MRALLWSIGLVLILAACTQGGSTASTSSSPSVPASSTPSTTPTGAVLADGTPLPGGCPKGATASQTVAFVSAGRAWALDPRTDALSCLFAVADPGPFAWGPQGDRVLLADLRVRGIAADAPSLPPVGAEPATFGWGHPVGLAVVYADGPGVPQKRFMEDGKVESLSALPAGTYLQIVYHPSGLALAFVVERAGKQAIWFSTNEGKDPQRLVFSEQGTKFTSIAFSPDGEKLWWTAEHRQGYPELHWMDLADRSGFETAWTGKRGTYADDLSVSPSGHLVAFTMGTTCEERRAFTFDGGSIAPVLPKDAPPSEAIGWVDQQTVLLRVGGCGEQTDVYVVDVEAGSGGAALLVSDVEIAAPRTVVKDAPTEVPSPPGQPEEAPPGGVG
jgi:hypothetical protein